MKCEICDEQTATMWVEKPALLDAATWTTTPFIALPSCNDCGPQLGYKILAPLEPVEAC